VIHDSFTASRLDRNVVFVVRRRYQDDVRVQADGFRYRRRISLCPRIRRVGEQRRMRDRAAVAEWSRTSAGRSIGRMPLADHSYFGFIESDVQKRLILQGTSETSRSANRPYYMTVSMQDRFPRVGQAGQPVIHDGPRPLLPLPHANGHGRSFSSCSRGRVPSSRPQDA
jgi:hypothetical protein